MKLRTSGRVKRRHLPWEKQPHYTPPHPPTQASKPGLETKEVDEMIDQLRYL